MPIIQCSHCNKNIHKAQWEINRAKHSFCSKECKNEFKLTQRPIYKCEQCGKEFRRKKSTVEKSVQIFCSNKCKFESRKNYIKTKCDYCSKDIETPAHLYNKHEKHFCNAKCMGLEKVRQIRVKCDCCETEFFVKQSKMGKNEKYYCSNKCRYKGRETYVDVICTGCGKSFLRAKRLFDAHDNHYCNKRCQMKHMMLISIDMSHWEFYEKYTKLRRKLAGTQNYKNWRKEVLLLAKHQCSECDSKKDLHVHHIASLYSICKKYNFDYATIKDSPEFIDTNNGKCLCSKCHSSVHTVA